jgi:hypothetical protein
MPYANPGDVLTVNGGDIAKDVGLIPDWAASPHGRPRWSDRVLVTVPNAGETVPPTFRVIGDARVFEAQFAWELRDAGGQPVAGGHARAATCCNWACFFFDVDLSGLAPQRLTLAVWQPSARDGAPTGTVEVPLQLGP